MLRSVRGAVHLPPLQYSSPFRTTLSIRRGPAFLVSGAGGGDFDLFGPQAKSWAIAIPLLGWGIRRTE